MINVTKTYLPKKNKYMKYVDKIYNSSLITNNGPLVKELELRLAEYLGVKNLILVANGTLALEIAYRTLGIKGFAVTTPFSFVATTSSLVTNSILPIFSDIDNDTLNIDPDLIADKITTNTSLLVPAHIFGNACEVEKIEAIAQQYNLKTVYDACHAFGVKYKEQSILNYGDISTLSFHATKVFHTIEGGGLIIKDDTLVEKARYLINFGIKGPDSIPELGINAKMNEFEAAMGLCMLDEIDYIFERRAEVYNFYIKSLDGIVKMPKQNAKSTNNFSYFPIIFENESTLFKVQQQLNSKDIFPRRYFGTSLDSLPYIEPKQFMPISRNVSSRIMCIPLFPDLERSTQIEIIRTIGEALEKS